MKDRTDDGPVEDDADGDEREDHQKKLARVKAARCDRAKEQREPGGDAEDAGEARDRLGGRGTPRLFGRRVTVEIRLERADGRCEIGKRRLLVRVHLQLLKALRL